MSEYKKVALVSTQMSGLLIFFICSSIIQEIIINFTYKNGGLL